MPTNDVLIYVEVMDLYIPPFTEHFSQKSKYFAIVYTTSSQSLIKVYETEVIVAYLKVNTSSFRQRIFIYKHISFYKIYAVNIKYFFGLVHVKQQ